MEDDYLKEGTVDLLEDCWFFGNLLNTKAKILRCNSDPSPSLKEEEMFELKKNTSKSNNLLRSPSLPPNLDKGKEEEEDWDEEDGPRMGDLIRQAMPCKLARTPSLPPYMIKIKKGVSSPQDVVMMPKGPTMTKLTRRSSLDPSLLLPPKHTSKGMKSNFSAPSTSKNLQQRRSGKNMKPRNLERSMSLKTLSYVEVQGFRDLGFKFDKDELSPNVVNKLAGLQIKEEEEKRNPTLSEAWNATQTTKQWSYSPPIPKWIDTKSSAEDMKAQIKFWARSIASNVVPSGPANSVFDALCFFDDPH
ncbi:hypothetical protein V2J09_007293 [Rumex salicifolius]